MKAEPAITPLRADTYYISLFNAMPGNSILLCTDAPRYTIVAATPNFYKASGTQRENLIGKGLFDVFPSNPDDAGDTGENALRASLELVLKHKELHQLPTQRYDVAHERDGYTERYWNATNSPVLNDAGEVLYILHTAEEITDNVLSKRRDAAFQDIQKAFDLFIQAPVAVCIVNGADYIVELANEEMLRFLGRTPAIVGKPLLQALPEAGIQGLIHILDEVRRTGEPYKISNFPAVILINGIREQRYFDLVFKPYFQNADDRTPSSIFCVAHNVTYQVLVQKKIEQSEQQVRSLVESAPFPIAVYVGREMRIELANQSIIDVWGKGPDVIGKLYAKVLPELGNQEIYAQLDEVFMTGVPFHAKYQRVDLEVAGSLKPFYFNYSFTPLFDASGKVYGVMNTGAEVTDLVLATQKVEQSEQNFRSMILQAPVAMCILLGPDHLVDIANDAMIKLWGKPREAVMHKPIFTALPDAQNQGLEEVLAQVYRTGIAFQASEHPVNLVRNGRAETVYQNFVYEPYKDAAGNRLGILAISIDVTAQVATRKVVEESRQELQLAIEVADLGTFHVDLKTNMGTYSHRVQEWFHFSTTREQMDVIFAAIHPEDQRRVIRAVEETQLSEVNSRHEVTYRVVNPGDGTVRHLRSIGRTIFDTNGSATEIRGVIQDVTAQMQFQKQLQETEAELQRRVQERTLELENLNQELKRSNANLEEFAYAASHDMKEPIRKIHFFADRLKQELETQLNNEQSRLFSRMEHAAKRMNLLIEDLLTYSHVSKGMSSIEPVDLNQQVQHVLHDLELEIEQKHATITVDPLPVISGHRRQMQQLFQNLISNALKYQKAGVPPEIRISTKEVRGHEIPVRMPQDAASKKYHLIQVADNGIGFEQEDAHRIFNVFTRLHGNTEYRGSGVGLSIARKVAENHNGYIWAESELGKGATFRIVFPAD